jgi:hypothetical protein
MANTLGAERADIVRRARYRDDQSTVSKPWFRDGPASGRCTMEFVGQRVGRASYTSLMAEADQILELTRRALDSFDEPGKSLTAVVRQAHRIAVRRHDFAGQVWFLMQLSDVAAGTSRSELADLQDKLETLLGKEAGSEEYRRQTARYFATRRMADGKNYNGVDVEQLEATLAHIQSTYDNYGVAPPD